MAEHLERRWQSLHNPEWDEDLDSDSDVDPELESRLNEAQSQVHANKRLQMPSPKSAASPSVEAPSLEYSPEWAWDVAGAYNIRSELLKETFQLDSGDPVSMHIIYSKNAKGRHMWATFTFGTSVSGTMRLAPRSIHGDLLGSQEDWLLKRGIWPEPSSKGEAKWYLSYRALDNRGGINFAGGSFSFEFMMDKDGDITFWGVLNHGSMPIPFYGERTMRVPYEPDASGDFEVHKVLETLWRSMRPPAGQTMAQIPSQQPPKASSVIPGIIYDKNIDGLFKDHPGRLVIENPPHWAWDLTGHWTITCPAIYKTFKLAETETLSMKIHIANFPNHTRIGRQLWASFEFGEALKGYMRFRPMDHDMDRDCDKVDSSWAMKPGQWPGLEKFGGQESWFYRWKGKTASGLWEDDGGVAHDVQFGIGKDGSFTMKGDFMYGDKILKLKAVKERCSTPPRGAPSSIASLWDKCRAKKN